MAEDLTSPAAEELAIFFESTPGTSHANAAAWAGDEGTDTFRPRFISFDPGAIKQEAVEDPAMVERATVYHPAIHGLKSGSGVPFSFPLAGTDEVTATDTQVALDFMGRFLEHCWGGIARGNTDTIDTVASDVDWDPGAVTNLLAGMIVGIEDADDTTRVYPQRIESISGTSVLGEPEMDGWNVSTSDNMKAACTNYVDVSNLDSSGSDYNTISVLYRRGAVLWQIDGCHAMIERIYGERGQVPRIEGTIMWGKAKPPGDGAPSAPTWTGSKVGGAGRAVGGNGNTRVWIMDHTSDTPVSVTCESFDFRPGVPIVPQNTVTSLNDNMDGIQGYTHGLVRPQLDLVVAHDTDWQDDWDTTGGQAKFVLIAHTDTAGKGWCICLPQAYLNGPPTSGKSVINTMALSFSPDEGDSNGATPLLRSPFAFARF